MKRFLLASLLAFVAIPGSAYAATALSFVSTPTSFIGKGMSVNVTPADNFEFSSRVGVDNRLVFLIENLAVSPPLNQRYWILVLWGPLNQTLTPGFYDLAGNARDFGYIENPHLFFFGNDSITLHNLGYFNVLEAVYDSSGAVERFAVDFTQFENRDTTRRIDGQLRYNSNYGAGVVPEPATFVMIGLAFAVFRSLRLGKKCLVYS